jgi:hypothetical protein
LTRFKHIDAEMAPQKRARRDEDDEEVLAVQSASSSLRQDNVSPFLLSFMYAIFYMDFSFTDDTV